jgi:hypothetical protein
MKAKSCFDCKHFKKQTKGGDFIGFSCCGDQRKGRRWAPSAAAKDGRCGPRKVWFAAV